MFEIDSRVSGNTLIVLEGAKKSARVRLVNDDNELVAVANSGKDALDLFMHPFAMIDRFKMFVSDYECDPDKYIYDAEIGELVPK